MAAWATACATSGEGEPEGGAAPDATPLHDGSGTLPDATTARGEAGDDAADEEDATVTALAPDASEFGMVPTDAAASDGEASDGQASDGDAGGVVDARAPDGSTEGGSSTDAGAADAALRVGAEPPAPLSAMQRTRRSRIEIDVDPLPFQSGAIT